MQMVAKGQPVFYLKGPQHLGGKVRCRNAAMLTLQSKSFPTAGAPGPHQGEVVSQSAFLKAFGKSESMSAASQK